MARQVVGSHTTSSTQFVLQSLSTRLLLLGTLINHTALASAPDLTTYFNVTNPTVNDFTLTRFRNLQAPGSGIAQPHFAAFNMNFSGLNGLGLTAVLFEFGPQSQIDPHTHPRATEMFCILSGQVDAGFVDTANDLFRRLTHSSTVVT